MRIKHKHQASLRQMRSTHLVFGIFYKYNVCMISFEWNSDKNSSNQKKHGISFEEAQTVFYDENAIQFYDEHSSTQSEDRFLLLGLSNKLNMLLICHCERNEGNTIRIISARKATKKEQKFYKRG